MHFERVKRGVMSRSELENVVEFVVALPHEKTPRTARIGRCRRGASKESAITHKSAFRRRTTGSRSDDVEGTTPSPRSDRLARS